MTLKIERNSDGRRTLIRLIGRVRSGHIEELKKDRRQRQKVSGMSLQYPRQVRISAHADRSAPAHRHAIRSRRSENRKPEVSGPLAQNSQRRPVWHTPWDSYLQKKT